MKADGAGVARAKALLSKIEKETTNARATAARCNPGPSQDNWLGRLEECEVAGSRVAQALLRAGWDGKAELDIDDLVGRF